MNLSCFFMNVAAVSRKQSEMISSLGFDLMTLFFWNKRPNQTRNGRRASRPRRHQPQSLIQQVRLVDAKDVSTMRRNSAENEVETAIQHADQKLKLSVVSFGLTLGGTFVTPWLMVASMPLLLYLLSEFVESGYKELVHERRIGIGVIDAITSATVLGLGYFNMCAIFSILYSASQKLTLSTRDTAKKELVNIMGEQPRTVWVIQNGVEVSIPVENIQLDDALIVQAGETIAVDGIVVDGIATVDQRLLTGESAPAEKVVGSTVFAATVVLSGRLKIRVEHAGSATVAAQIGEILNNTADFKSSLESRAERIVDVSVAPTLALSGLALVTLGPVSSVSILLSYFGYNMRVIAPLSIMNYLKMATENSILVKDGRALEQLYDIDTVVFDKTGTLTEEQPQVGDVYAHGAYTAVDVLRYAVASEHKQTHPIALAILDSAEKQNIIIPPVENASYDIGLGLTVQVEGKTVQVGSERFMQQIEVDMPDAILHMKEACQQHGFSLVYVAISGQFAGAIELRPTIRPEAQAVVDALKTVGLSIRIISGDREAPTRYLAHALGIDTYYAETLPEDKAVLIEQLQADGHSVCFIGDGINDSISLKQANVSISLKGASTIATDTAQIVLMSGDLGQLPRLFEIAHQFDANMKGNMASTIIPGLVTIGGVYFFHFGILASCVLYNVGLAAGITNAMAPSWWKDEAPS